MSADNTVEKVRKVVKASVVVAPTLAALLHANIALADCETENGTAICHAIIVMNQDNLGAVVGTTAGPEMWNALHTQVERPMSETNGAGWFIWQQRDGKLGEVRLFNNGNGTNVVETFIVNSDNTVSQVAGDAFNNGTNEDGLNLPASSGAVSPVTVTQVTTPVQIQPSQIVITTPSGNITVPQQGNSGNVNIATGGSVTINR